MARKPTTPPTDPIVPETTALPAAAPAGVAPPLGRVDEAEPIGTLGDRFLVLMLRMRKKLFHRSLSLTRLGWIITLGISVVAGTVLYAALELSNGNSLINKIKAVDGIVDLCVETTGLDPVGCGPGNGFERSTSEQLMWSLLIEAAVLDATEAETPDELNAALTANPAAKAVADYLTSDGPGGEAINPRQAGSIDLVIGLTSAMCRNSSTAPDDEFKHDRIAQFAAGVYPPWVTSAEGMLQRDTGGFGILGDLSSALRFAPSTSVSDVQILSELMILSGAQVSTRLKDISEKARLDGLGYGYEANLQARCGQPGMSPREFYLRMVAFEKMAAYLLGRIGSNPDVRTATTDLTYYTGYEQYFIILTGIFALLLILLRGLASMATARGALLAKQGADEPVPTEAARTLQAFVHGWLYKKATETDPAKRAYYKDQLSDELASGRWPVRFAIATLPALGFIGTVRGILMSLSNADQIVWASTTPERADAITALSGNLGLAFATTMIALLFGVVISFFSALEAWFEERTALTLFRDPFN